ncbi:MAG: carboxypeptidase-like regulatory domain-containing protein, partial [Bacteroidales bacterium]|nr:carboxypeptidase-like regulatory domain-containing protein [Bacteroidales bacterium]
MVKIYSQEKNHISGKVIDAKTSKTLPFVNIVYNEKGLGTTTNINGEFTINNPKVKSLYVSYIGYYNDTIRVKNNKQYILIKLQAKKYTINKITIFPSVNPAERIIKKVIENKDINNPEKQHSFSYTSYNKNIFTVNTDAKKTNIASDS